MRSGLRGAGISALALCVCLLAPNAWAQKSKKPKPDAKTDSASSDTEKAAGAEAKAGGKSGAGAAGAGAAGADTPGAGAADKKGAAVIKVETDKQQDGMKTYTFGPQEVEGRLKSPQIQYFLRRVRAEFEAGTLGHRSFLRELSHTRHHHSLR